MINVNGGFGNGQKFPSHSTLLYLLYNLAVDDSPSIRTICIKTLDAMRLRGLNDHLQGGIFRYCVDSEWTIPHFEKMLYDQAMALWTYSLAYRVMGKDEYRIMAKNIIRCLDESFELMVFIYLPMMLILNMKREPLISGVMNSLKMSLILKSLQCFQSHITLERKAILRAGII